MPRKYVFFFLDPAVPWRWWTRHHRHSPSTVDGTPPQPKPRQQRQRWSHVCTASNIPYQKSSVGGHRPDPSLQRVSSNNLNSDIRASQPGLQWQRLLAAMTTAGFSSISSCIRYMCNDFVVLLVVFETRWRWWQLQWLPSRAMSIN